jgi:hypothetical protein
MEAMEAAVEGQELHNGEMNMDSIRSLEDQCVDRQLVVWRRWQLKKQTREMVDFGRSWLPHKEQWYAVPSLQCTRDMIVRGTLKRRTLVRRRRTCHNGLWGCDSKKQLHVRVERTSCRIFRKTIILENVIEKQIVRSSTGLSGINNSTLWKFSIWETKRLSPARDKSWVLVSLLS